jgi:transglutaminase-like putative cysteine protease
MTQSWTPHSGGWRLHIVHETGFTYDGEARASYNEARLTPSTMSTQSVLASELRVKPTAARSSYRDYWGNRVIAFQLDESHTALEVTAEATVETSAATGPLGALTRGELFQPAITDLMDELLAPTDQTAVGSSVIEVVRDRASRLETHETAELALETVRGMLTYVPGVTGVHTTAREALSVGKGVCQDFTHLCVGILRGLGIPSRYVSGYLHPDLDAEPGQTGRGESHAWVEYFAGEWNAIDPTSGNPVGPRHVVVARGRDYSDAAPLKGIYHGAPSTSLGVTVTITRLA